MIKINYESDFKLTEKFEERLVGIPFKFVYATNSGTYTASYDGEAYTNCKRNEDGSITIIFNKHGLGVGKLKVRREFYVPDEDFPDGVYNIVSNDTTDIMLVEGKTDNTDVEEEFNPPYIEGGGEVVSVEIVDNLDSDAPDKALSARQGKELKGMIPTKVSELENDEGYITEIPEGYATKEDVSEAVSGKQDALTLTVKDNGNIIIGNISGQSKEFMPATPSGDPMHWAYVSAGAEYNDSGTDIVKDAPWKDYVDTEEEKKTVHKADYWYLNGLGDLTSKEMRVIYAESQFNSYPSERIFLNKTTRTMIDRSTAQPATSSRIYQYYNNTNIIAIGFIYRYVSTLESTFYNCRKLKHIYTPLNVQWVSRFHSAFANCNSLITVRLSNVRYDISFASSQFISKSSVKYMIDYATPTSAITITLHADAYARFAADADIVAALEAKPLVTLVSA